MRRLISVLIIAFVLFGFYKAFNGLQGFCIDDWKRYSDRELIEIVVSDILMSYPQDVSGFDNYTEKFNGVDLPQIPNNYLHPINVVYYKNINEFFEMNKGCCSIVKRRNIDEGELVYWKSLFGGGWRFVRVVYKLKYISDDQTKSRLVVWMGPVNSCGKPVEKTSQSFLR